MTQVKSLVDRKKNYKLISKLNVAGVYIVLIIFSVIMLAPFVWMLLTSVKTSEEIAQFTLFPKIFQWKNFLEVFKQVPFHLFYFNSIWTSIVITLGKLTTASMAGYAFARIKFKGRNIIFLAYLTTLMIPRQVTMIPIFIMFKTIGLIDTYIGLVLPQMFTAYGTFMMRQFFLTIPKELEESASIDGAGTFTIFYKIFLPLSKPALATLGTFVFIWSWNNFMWPLIILNSLEKMTLPIGIAMFQSMYSTQYHLLMAAAVLAIVPVMMVYLFSQKFFTKGIVMTGLKG